MPQTPMLILDHASLETKRQALAAYAASPNTEAGAKGALTHYVFDFGRTLPATPNDIVHYLIQFGDAHAGQDRPRLSMSTLTTRLAHLATWHQRAGLRDPTKDAEVKDVLKKLRQKHGQAPKQAPALRYEPLIAMADALSARLRAPDLLDVQRAQCLRDRALLLIGFWRGFRVSEISALRFEHLTHASQPARNGTPARRYMQAFLANTKGDRLNKGAQFTLHAVPELPELCPLDALRAWQRHIELQLSAEGGGLYHAPTGPVFRRIFKDGSVTLVDAKGLSRQAVNNLLKDMASLAGQAIALTTHSLRRGALNEMLDAGVPLADAAKFVQHKNIQTTSDYLDESDEVQQSMIAGAVAVQADQAAKAGQAAGVLFTVEVTLSVDGLESQHTLNIVGASPEAVMRTIRDQVQRSQGVIAPQP